LRPLHYTVHTDWNRRVDTCDYQVDAEIAASTETRTITLEAWRNILPNTMYLMNCYVRLNLLWRLLSTTQRGWVVVNEVTACDVLCKTESRKNQLAQSTDQSECYSNTVETCESLLH